MSTCTQWENRAVLTCKNWASQLEHVCSSWADEGSYACSQWADEGSQQCSDWEECHWYTPWNCIAGFFCNAFYWVANWICQAWFWVANLVCQAFAWVVKAFCAVWGWVLSLVCVAWDTITCALLALARLLASLFGRGKRSPPKFDHVFVLMLENRSFDHMFGFSGITGVGLDGQPTPFNEGFDQSVNKNFDPVQNKDVFVSFPAEFQLKGIDQDPGHEFEDTLTALCGKDAAYSPVPGGYPAIDNSGFIQNYFDPADPDSKPSTTPDRIMHCFGHSERQDQLPVLRTLAREFAICDKWFSSLPGPTWPNRFFLLAATSGGLDDSPSSLDVVKTTTVDGYRFENGNIFDLLDANCINWRIFEGDDFPVSFAMSGMNLNLLQGRFSSFDDFAEKINDPGFNDRFVFIEPKYGAHGFDATGPGDFTCGNSMHPLDDVTRGEKLVKYVYETIRNSPHWEKSLLLITFDEHGGFYDHVKPPAAVPPGDLINQEYVQKHFLFDQLGVRVPAIVISPYTPRNVIDHTVYDHTSMLATVERMFGIGHLTNRDKAANDFLHLFPLPTPRTDAPTSLPAAATNPNPLPCESDDEPVDQLQMTRAELRMARDRGVYRDRRVAEFPITSTQTGFVQIALLKVLQDVEYPERVAWIEDYKRMKTGVDAALFMTEAKLKFRHAIDVKKIERESRENLRKQYQARKQWNT